MAESESGADRSEDPTARRLQEAREHGQLPRSRELSNFATMVGGSVTLVMVGGTLGRALVGIMKNGMSIDPDRLFQPDVLQAALGTAIKSALFAVLPVFGVLCAAVIVAALAIGGWNFSTQALVPDFSRMSPLAGIKRLFGLHGATELGKALLKCAVVGAVCAGVTFWLFGDVMRLAHMAPRAAIGRGVGLLSTAFVWLSASLALIAAVDVPLQLIQYTRSLRMTRQEVRDEAKDSDGRPEVKSRIRQMQQQNARRRMMHKVPDADVVIVNPTHFAVALKYDPKKMRAPRVLAKGADLVALNIRRIAEENRVAVFESPKLARALYRSTDLDREIPTGLYGAVAQVLSYIFRIRAMNPTLAARVARPEPALGAEFEDA
jgi:flagellar biosynthetic protein FlhB